MRKAFLLAVLQVITMVAMAVPAHPKPVKVQQPDGTFVTVSLHGDEWLSFTTTEDGYTVVKDKCGYYVYAALDSQQLQPTALVAHDAGQRSSAERSFLTGVKKYQAPAMKAEKSVERTQVQQLQRRTLASRRATDYSKFRGLVVLIQFNDQTFSRSDYAEIANGMLNQKNYTGYDSEVYTGSVRDYFSDNSGGKFQPQFDVVGPVTVDYSQYDGRSQSKAIATAALTAVDDEVDFSVYDGDSDGYVDLVFFLIAGNGANYSGNDSRLWWPHRSALSNVIKDGVYIKDYASSVELYGWTARPETVVIDGIGTICHEFSHVLGLPDFYDADYESSGGESAHPDEWSLMAGGCYSNVARTPVGYSLYERYSVGFTDEPEVISEQKGYTLEPLHVNQKGYRIDSPVENEFFLLENRRNDGSFKWDAYLPGSGLLVHRVDKTSAYVWNNNRVNNNPAHNYYEVVWACGVGYRNSVYDTFPGAGGVTELNSHTAPANLLTHNGSETVLGLAEIQENGADIVFSVTSGSGIVRPTNVVVSPTPTMASLSWTGYADSYEMRYGTVPDGTEVVPTWLQYDNDTYKSSIGKSTPGTWTWGVMYPGSQVTGHKLTKVSWFEVSSKYSSDITVNIYSGGDTAPGATLLRSFTVSPETIDDYRGFHEVTLDAPVAITAGENLWITLTATGTHIMSTCEVSEPRGQWVYSGGEWKKSKDLSSSFENRCWMIRACMDVLDIDEEAVDWNTVNTVSPSCDLTELTPETTYVFRVRGDYGTDGYSPWTALAAFATVPYGDANGDGEVTICDAVGIVNSILGNQPAHFVFEAADVNGDGKVTISDAVGVVDMIINDN